MRAKVAVSSRQRGPHATGPERAAIRRKGTAPHLRLLPSMLDGVPEVGHSFAEISIHQPEQGPDVSAAVDTGGSQVDLAVMEEATAQGEDERLPEAEMPPKERAQDTGQPEPGVTALLDQATAGTPEPLPFRAQLEARLGRPLDQIEAYRGPEARAALDVLGAEAASIDNKIILASDTPDLSTVAHEVAHVLQAGGTHNTATGEIVGPDSEAEHAAEQLAGEVAATPDAHPAAPVDVSGQLEPGSIALQRTDVPQPETDSGVVAVVERPIEAVPPQPEEPSVAEPGPAGETAASDQAAALEGEAGREPSAEAEGTEESAFQLPPAPEPGVTAEDVAAREAALAEAEAILAGARDVSELMGGFAAAPPSVKASQQGQLSQNATNLAQQESQQYQEELPDFHATLSGEAQPAEPLAVESPEARDIALEETTPAPAPEPDIPETPDPGQYNANADVTRVIDQFFGGAETADRAGQVGESLREVSTTDPDIPRNPGPPPVVPLEGETDPERIANQATEGIANARGVRDEAQTAVLNGPGPEQAQPVQLDEAYAVDALNQPSVEPVAPVEGAQSYLNMGLPPEVQTAFDQQQQQVMQESMTGAVGQADQAATDRDQQRQVEVEATEAQAADLSSGADEQQRTQIGEARATIQTERQATIDAQTDAVTAMEASAETRREVDRGAIEDRVSGDQGLIEGRYETAEANTTTEIQAGERDAEIEKQKAEEASEDQSWWDKAVSFVRQAFSALVAAINSVFDAVRAAVNDILDAAKAFAMELIDAAASFIKDAIAAYGEFLKFAVDGLLGDVFPGLAAALNEKIDGAVAAAQGLVDTVADGLKAGVAALVDGLKAGLNKILDAYQAALNVAIGFVEAALTGDWSALARKVLEAVLRVIGVDPESFYAFIGRAEETFQIIIDNPLQFLSNVVDGFLGGVRLFATNILTHLQAGIIGWLTGTLGSAGITLPERFDLMGVLSLAQQILGLTWERIRAKAVKLVGEQNVARLEHVFSYIETLVTEGWPGLWQRIQADLGALVDTVLGGIKSFIVERVIMAAITKIASLFSPVGAVIQLVLAAWNLFTFLRDQLQRIFQVVQTVIDAIGDIARGILDPAKAKVEQVLASLLPLALDLLARLLGLGNVGAKVREIIESIQQTIDRAIDGLIARVLAAFSGGGAATAPAAAPVGAQAEGQPVGGVIEESFRVAGEPHTIRAVVTDGQASLVMASDTFVEITRQMHQLLENLRTIYTRPGGHVHGTAQAAQLEADFTAIEDAGVALVLSINRETDPAREQKLADDGIDHLKAMFNALGLPEAQQPGPSLPLGHATTNQTHTFGRATWFEVNPLSELSLGRGAPAEDDIPGIQILSGYHRGHLVANSLGGPGSPINVVPMSANANLTNIGMRRIERDLFDALQKTRGKPEAVPPYIFKYRVSAVYNSDGGLQLELEQRAGAAPGSEARLFGLAAQGVELSQDQLLHELRNPALDNLNAAQRSSLAVNIRSRLAWYYMAHTFNVDAQIVQQPERKDMRTVISSSKPVTNHTRQSLAWRG